MFTKLFNSDPVIYNPLKQKCVFRFEFEKRPSHPVPVAISDVSATFNVEKSASEALIDKLPGFQPQFSGYKTAGITASPKCLINGYHLPDLDNIPDLITCSIKHIKPCKEKKHALC